MPYWHHRIFYKTVETTGYTTSRNQQFIDHMRNVVNFEIPVVDIWEDVNETFLKIAVCDFNGTKNLLQKTESPSEISTMA